MRGIARLRRFFDSFRERRHELELDDEIQSNLQLQIDDNTRAGMSPEEARRAALVKFGGIEATKEACRDRRGVPCFDGIARDLKFAVRMLRKSPLFTSAAVLSLGLGIGANTTVFSIAYAAMQGLPFKNADRIVYVSEVDRSRGQRSGPAMTSQPDFQDIRSQSHSFVDLATFGTGTYNISDDVSTPERVIGSRVTMNFFSLVGQRPLIGRDFLPDDDAPGTERVAIIGYGIWQNRYGGSEAVLQRSLRVNGVAHRIIGVMPRGMKFPLISDIWMPSLPPSPQSLDRAARSLDVFGVLKQGVSIGSAETELRNTAIRLENEFPQTNKNIEIHVRPFAEEFDNARNRNATWALIAAVCFVLMIVCANLANLLLARAVNRVRETAIRMAIGATRWQVIRQFLTESLLLSFAGGSLGLGIAVIAVRALSSISDAIRISARLPFWITVSVDYHVYLYLIAVCFVTGVLFGLTPALQIARTHAGDRLKDGSNAAGISIRTRRLTAVLVTSQIALTLTLLVAAGLMIRSVVRFQAFDTDPNAVYASLVLAPPKYANPASRVLFVSSLIGELEGRLGARAITAATGVAGNVTWREIETDQKPLPETATLVVIPGYFNTLSVPILHGRDFDDADGRPERSVAIVNQQFASQHWPGQDPIGKRIRKTTPAGGPWLTVIGVAGNQQVEDSEAPQPVVYTPYRQEPSPSLVLIARSQVPRDELVRVLRAEVQKADPDLPLFNVMTKQEYLAQLGVPLRLFAWLFGAFAVLAFVMSLIGIYGVTAYSVAQRTREIGIRVTLGASGHSVLWLVLKQGFRRLLTGLLLGFGGALAISRALAGMLFHTAPTDVATYVIIVLLFAGTTVAACLIPARHATKVDPARSLRL